MSLHNTSNTTSGDANTPAGSPRSGAAYSIALDAMGSDGGAIVVVDAARLCLQRHPDVHFMLFGDPDAIAEAEGSTPLPADRVEICMAEEVVTMQDTAAVALRNKKRSSMRLAINAVKDGRAEACVSAGNTGALMAVSKFVLKTVPGIDRPAIATTIPARGGHTHMLDLGANVDSSAEHLYQFAVMGSALAAAVDGDQHPPGWQPRVGLLNIGSEDIKGNEQVKEATPLLQESDLNYIGYVEADEIYTDRADVVVCDGFVGNVSLKTSEGVARMVSYYLREEFTRSWRNKLIALIAKPVLRAFANRIDPRHYNGASLLGLKGVVVKSHGGADAVAFANAVDIAVIEIRNDVPATIARHRDTALDAA